MLICQSERLDLRLLTHDDAEDYLQLLNEPSFIANIGDKKVRTIEEAKDFLTNGIMALQANKGFSMYACVIRATGEFIGVCGLIEREGINGTEIGYALLEKYHGKGFGKEAARAVVKHSNEVLGMTSLVAITSPKNKISMGLLTSLGFQYQKQVNLPQGDLVNLYQVSL